MIECSTIVTVKSTQTLLCFDRSWEINSTDIKVDKSYEYKCGNEHCGFKTMNIDDIIYEKEFASGIKRCLENIP